MLRVYFSLHRKINISAKCNEVITKGDESGTHVLMAETLTAKGSKMHKLLDEPLLFTIYIIGSKN